MGAATSLFDLEPDELAAFLQDMGQPGYRARQVLRWAYRGASSYQEMSDLPADVWTIQTRLGEQVLTPVAGTIRRVDAPRARPACADRRTSTREWR